MEGVVSYVCSALITSACLLAAVLFASYLYVTSVVYDHFRKRGVVYDRPTFPFGSLKAAVTAGKLFPFILAEMHAKYRHEKVVGFFALFTKSMLLIDRDVIRCVLVKDFDNFDDRGMYYDKQRDPLSAHLTSLGGEEWRPLRARLSPTFSSGKVKAMLPLVVVCADQMTEYIAKSAGNGDQEVNLKPIMSRFGLSVISTTAFGLESDAFTDEDSQFFKMTNSVFEITVWKALRMSLLFNAPVSRFLRLRFLPKSISDFFRNTIHKTLRLRESQGIVRNDFLQLLIQLRKPSGGDEEEIGLTEDEVAALAFMFILAGFDTSSNAICFCLHELAHDKIIQQRVVDDVKRGLTSSDSDVITYDALGQMEYLDMVVDESLRKYPPIPWLLRRCKEDYQVPNSEVTIAKDTIVHVSVMALHHDPELFLEPDRFIPERFSKENRGNIKPYSYMPFGEGPRYCIGSRFGKLVAKAGVASVLRRFEVLPPDAASDAAPAPIVFDTRSVTLAAEGGVRLRLVPRQ